MLGIYNKNNRGLTLLEALISTLIVGIGFVAIFQMVQYSITSIDVSSDRNKGNYLINMVAEDMLANKSARRDNVEFVDILKTSEWSITQCVNGFTEEVRNNTPDNIMQTWNKYFDSGITKCRSDLDERRLTIIEICNSATSIDKTKVCVYTNNEEYTYTENGTTKSVWIYDPMYFGKMEINFNKGNKTRNLYFQIK